MRKYKVVKDNKEFLLIEKNTNALLKKSSNKSNLMKLAKYLEGGGGFNGWTPAFVALINKGSSK